MSHDQDDEGDRKLGAAICQAQWGKDLSAGGWELGWRVQYIT